METGFSKLSSKVTLRRILGRWDLTAVGINQVIGSGIFLLPSLVTAKVGAWSVMAFVLGIALIFYLFPRFLGEAQKFQKTIQEELETFDIPQTEQIKLPEPPPRPSIPVASEDEFFD